jgi:hypothetical protein
MPHWCGHTHARKRRDNLSEFFPASRKTPVGEGAINAPTQQEIADLAYSYWQDRGGGHGSPWEDWFRAERELRRRRQP